jgi:hypothetical protein
MSDLDTIAKENAANNKAGREARQASRDAAEKDFKDQREAMIKMNTEKMEADAKLRPTPTPEEIASARAGNNVDVKESDGAPLQNERHHIANAAQQIEVGRQLPPAQPVGSDADLANQKSLTGQAQTDRSNVSSDNKSGNAKTTLK